MVSALIKHLPSSWFEKTQADQQPKFGTFYGIYVPSILMMFGVIIFLRLGWILGSAGLYSTLFIVTFASLIVLITTLSMSVTATNSHIGKGGVYYMLSRSLGIETGSAIGLPLFLKQGISISFCIVGFAESFHSLFPQFSMVTIGVVTLIALTILAYSSTNLTLKIQMIIFAIIIASLYSLFSGGDIQHVTNESPAPIPEQSFWKIFAIFFPALTGIESSVSLSGDLKNPSRSLPLGTITAVLTAYVVYMAIPIFLWSHVPQDLLVTDPLIMQHVAHFESLIILGIWGATLSSAIGGMLGAPRTMQALAEDGILPRFLAREFGPNKEPRIATCVTFIIALVGVCFGSINVIAPLLTMICLICYAMLNLAAGLEELMGNPSWRPVFHLPWIVSFTGALLCMIAMLMIDSGAAIMALFLVFVIYAVLKQKKMTATWEDIRYGILMFLSRSAIYRLAYATPSSRSWRPSFLVFTGKPSQVSNQILNFSTAITQTKGFLTLASFLPLETQDQVCTRKMGKDVRALLKRHHIEALVYLNRAKSVTSGMKQMILHYGIGPLTPNTIVCGSPSQEENLTNYLEVIKIAHEMGRNVVIVNDERKSENFFEDSHLYDKKEKGDIFVWWDDTCQRNSELMIVLAYMLRKNPLWKQARVCLMATAVNEEERQMRLQQFQDLIKRNRLRIETQVILADTEGSSIEQIKSLSSQAAMVFMGMRPQASDETLDSYAQYFQSLPHKSANFPSVALVMSSEQTNLQEVLQIEPVLDSQSV